MPPTSAADAATNLLSGAAPGPELAKAPTGIRGLDEILGGGVPQGRATLVTGEAGAGKTLLGLEFLIAGALKFGEPGVLVTFEESVSKIAENVRSLGYDLDGLQRDGQLAVLAFQVNPAEIFTAGEFDFEPLFAVLADAIGRTGAKRVVLDTVEVLFGAFGSDVTVRGELARLTRWLEERGVTAIVTGERGDKKLSRHGIEEYVSDCVLVLDNRVRDEICTRRLRVLKYRGSAHGTNEYPFVITGRGFTVLPVTSISLGYGASEERVSTGVARLDHMLGGGVYRGSAVLVSGTAGTGKSSLGAHMADAACARGERALLVLYEESPEQFMRNQRSIGLDLRKWQDAGLLIVWAARPSAYGLETHLAVLAALIDEAAPSIAVIDGVADLSRWAPETEVTAMISRKLDLLKARGITAVITTLGQGDETSAVGISSLVDTWLLLRNTESNGERNRLLFVIKSRGTAHSNQVREFLLTDNGIDLVDVYVGSGEVLTGSARLAQLAARRESQARRAEDLDRRGRELRRSIAQHEVKLAEVRDQLAAEQEELERIGARARDQATEEGADRMAMAAQRWADATPRPRSSDD